MNKFLHSNSRIEKNPFGKTPDGREVDIFTLSNSNGAEIKITNYGGRIVSVKVPDRKGNFDDVVLGFDDFADYERDNAFFGSIIGRFGNRIAQGRFSLGGKEYFLAKNNGENHLHGGAQGFDKRLWTAKPIVAEGGAKLELTYLSKDGEENYPGNLSVKVVYTLTENDELKIEYSASTDQDTIVNLTNHSYFNLAGAGTILDHVLQINADKFTPTGATGIPTGELRETANTPFDFRRPTKIGERINAENEQINFGKGYDHNFVLNKKNNEYALAASVYEPSSGRLMEIFTTEPGIQFYSGNYLDKVKGKNGVIYDYREGFCLETQHFPDSPNNPNFPTTVLRKGENFTSVTVYRFSIK